MWSVKPFKMQAATVAQQPVPQASVSPVPRSQTRICTWLLSIPAVIGALHAAVDEMADAGTFRGYAPELGYEFLRTRAYR